MIRYTYIPYGGAPAPFVYVTVRCRETGKQREDVPAQLDTGSDQIVLPTAFVEQLGLVEMGHARVEGFGGQITDAPTYAVDIAVRGLQAVRVKVLANDREPVVLLGRNVLNHHRILLDGPQGKLEIS